jgi:hypothetical protein
MKEFRNSLQDNYLIVTAIAVGVVVGITLIVLVITYHIRHSSEES